MFMVRTTLAHDFALLLFRPLLAMTEPSLTAYEDGLRALARIEKMLLEIVKSDRVCRLLMTAPGVGPITALTFRTAVDAVHGFEGSRFVAAVFGLTPRVHSSGETEQTGRITKSGDSMVRAMLYEAANNGCPASPKPAVLW